MPSLPPKGPPPAIPSSIAPGGGIPPHASLALELGGRLRHPDLQAPELEGRFGATHEGNRVTLQAQRVQRFQVDRPTIVSPVTMPTGLIFYQSKLEPSWTPAIPPDGIGSQGWSCPFKSTGPGICYLFAKGDWFLYLDQAASIDVHLLPAEDPGMAVRYLSEPGSAVVNGTIGQQRFALTALGLTFNIPANRDRRALTIQNTSIGGTYVHVGLGATPFTAPQLAVPGVGSTSRGIILQSLASITFAGETLYRGTVQLGCDVASDVAWFEIT